MPRFVVLEGGSRRHSVLLAAALAIGASSLACGGDAPPPSAPKKAEPVASWADVFDGTPDLYAVFRPRALKRDPVYGSFFKALMRAAVARGIARGDTMVAAVEGADELVVGLNRGLDAALVLRGVPASLDPQRVTDGEGKPLFRLKTDRAKVPEYEALDGRVGNAGGLFVLPDRTWAFALGDARTRAREVFTTPLNRPRPQTDAEALAVVRFSGALARSFERHPTLGPLAKKLTSATFALKPGKAGVVVSLAYEENGATAWAEMHAKRLASEHAKSAPWLKDAKIGYEGNTVVVQVAVPPRLLEELPNVSGSDLGL